MRVTLTLSFKLIIFFYKDLISRKWKGVLNLIGIIFFLNVMVGIFLSYWI